VNASAPPFEKLRVWHQALGLVEAVYRETRSFPTSELFGLTSQMRRAAVSIPANVVEGQARFGAPQFARFLDIAIGSTRELEALVMIARKLEFLDAERAAGLRSQISDTAASLMALVKWIRKNGRTPRDD
jgi:four helix bundle protein